MSNLKVEPARKLSIPRVPHGRFRSSSSSIAASIGNNSLWCGNRKSSATKSENPDSCASNTNLSHAKQQQQHHGGGGSGSGASKRRHSSFGPGVECGKYTNLGQFKRRKKDSGIIPPTKFLLGGNINDPLNLNGLNDGEIGRVINQVTPQTSPMPIPKHHTKVEVLIPPNINDPLNLNAGEEDTELGLNLISPKLKKRSRRKKKKVPKTESGAPEKPDNTDGKEKDKGHLADVALTTSAEVSSGSTKVTGSLTKPATLSLHPSPQSAQARQKRPDKIVSPVIPQPGTRKHRPSGHTKNNLRDVECDSGNHPKSTVQSGGSSQPKCDVPRYCYGNYDRYYGYRNPELGQDNRLLCFKKEWFKGKDVLDIGCNIGHVTLSVARDYSPRKIIGLDIDNKLIRRAKKNVFHYLRTDDKDGGSKFPLSLPICYGPITAAAVLKGGTATPKFPNNAFFIQGNYVLDSDELLEIQRPEFDAILCLSLTKWIQLNWGDEGLKRVFKRIYRQLRPGGKLILEAQAYASYGRRKKLSKATYENYYNMKFKPEQFTEYLLSKEVGFSTCEVVGTPCNVSKGFCRPIQLFTKSDASSSNTPDTAVEPKPNV